MASAELKLEVTCSICTDIYTNPITLICGHNFCHVCISKTFDNQHDREYFCPECMKRFSRRPELIKNPRLTNIADHFHSVEPKEHKPGNVCSYCVNFHVPAVTLCLHCEAFLCGVHKQAHSKSPEHVLTDPTTSLEDRRCPIHKKILEYYCTVDNTCICAHCLTSEHNGHRVSTISTFLQQQAKSLEPILEKLSAKREETEAILQSLQDHQRKVDETADGLTEKVTATMRDIRRKQEEIKKRILTEISRKKQEISLLVSNSIQQVEKDKSELHKKITQIEELSTTTNPLSALKSQDVLSCVLEEKYNLDWGMGSKMIHDAGDLEEAVILETLHSELSNIVVGAGKYVHAKDIQKVSLSAAYINLYIGDNELSYKSQTEAKTFKQEPYYRTWPPTQSKTQSRAITAQNQRVPLISGNESTALEMLLDVNTASNFLVISDNLKAVCRSDIYLGRPETSERFQSPRVLSTRGISSGKHELELEISKLKGRTGDSLFIGMCYPTIDRRRTESLIGDSNNAWGILVNDVCFDLIHNNKYTWLVTVTSERIKLELDYEAGKLIFYEMSDPIQHLRTFSATFTGPLHLIISIQGSGWIKILKYTHYL